MSEITIECDGVSIKTNVSKDDVFTQESRKAWIGGAGAIALGALFTALRWTEGPVGALRRVLAEHPEAPQEEKDQIQSMIDTTLARRAEHGDPWEGADA